SGDRPIDADEPRIVIDEDALAPETGRTDTRAGDSRPTAPLAAPITAIDIVDDAEAGALIHDRVIDREPAPPPDEPPAAQEPRPEDDADTGEIDIVVLDAPKKPRPERRTQIGVGPVPAATKPRNTDAAIAAMFDHSEDITADAGDATTVDLRPAPDDDTPADQLAAPPAPASDADTNPHLLASPPAPVAARSGAIPRAVIVEDDEDDDDEDRDPHTSEMTAAELDDAIPDRASELASEPVLRRRVEHDSVDDGWGPPGTTIPPPLLGAIPGGEEYEENSGAIPMPNVHSSPLIVSQPTLHS